jgi:hypothetical protein
MKDVSPAATYAALLPDIVKAGRDCGYAIAPHGSMARDFDLIAVPWTNEATSAEQVIMRIMSVTGATMREQGRKRDDGEWETVRGDVGTDKPHGRRAWSLFLGNSGMYLDVSVMPRIESAGRGSADRTTP